MKFNFKDLKSLEWRKIRNEYAASAFTFIIVISSFFLIRRRLDFPVPLMIPISGLFAILFCSWKGRVVYLVCLGCIFCFEQHFNLHYHASFRDVGTQALLTLHITNKDEVLAYISSIKTVEYLLPFLFVLGCLLEGRLRQPPLLKRSSIGFFGILFSLIILVLYQTWRPVGDYLKSWRNDKDFYLARQEFQFHSRDTQPDARKVCILVIGESHRKKEFDELVLEGDRAPLLKAARKRGELWEFDDMISHYPQTWFSVFTLMTRRSGDTQDVAWREKGLIELFKEAGFHTYCLSNERKLPSTIGYNFVMDEADEYINYREHSGTKFDHGMFPELDRILGKNEKKVLIVIKMVGCHFIFSTRHPKDFTPFTPCYTKKKIECRLKDKELLVNSYRNAMYYNATFFEELFKRVSEIPDPAFMLFLSDHGIINYDDGMNPYFGAAKSNFHIPCFIAGNEQFRSQLPAEKAKALTSHRDLPASNSYIFETMTSLAGIVYPGYREMLDLSSPNAVPAKERPVWVWKEKRLYDELP